METPDTTAGRLTECIMLRVRGKLPALPTHEFNRVYESILEELNSHPLPAAVDHYRTALEQIRDMDYRGNRHESQGIANDALNTMRRKGRIEP